MAVRSSPKPSCLSPSHNTASFDEAVVTKLHFQKIEIGQKSATASTIQITSSPARRDYRASHSF
jgi:hypothetical protein